MLLTHGVKLLSLLKCMMLEKKIIIFSAGAASTLSTFIYTLASLFPGLLQSLSSGTIAFSAYAGAERDAWAAHGLPLSIYSHVRNRKH